MGYDYDALYASTPEALGAPTQVFVDFFAALKGAPLRVLDVGCGQGRDALPIARRGHSVVGVDLSPAGVKDMLDAGAREGLAISGAAADITTYTPDGQFEVLLIDRTLHMLDEAPRLAVLTRLIDHVAPNGWALIADERSNMDGFKRVFKDSAHAWDITLEEKGTLFLRRR